MASQNVFLTLMTNSKPIQYFVLAICILIVLYGAKKILYSDDE